MTTKCKLSKSLFSIFFGMWMTFTVAQPALAGWPVTVIADTSPTTYAQLQQQSTQTATQAALLKTSVKSNIEQVAEYIKEAERWIQTVEHYSEMAISNVKRFTSLKGILGTIEKQLGLSQDTLKALGDIGDIIRGAFSLKNQFVSLIRTRLEMISNLEKRARSGIFNPQADLEDLQNYLKYSIGKDAKSRVITYENLLKNDPLLERLNYELQKVRAERAAKQKELDEINKQLGKESSLQRTSRVVDVNDNGQSAVEAPNSRVSLSPEAIQTLTLRAGQLEQQVQVLIDQENKLVQEIEARYKEMMSKYDSAYLKGRYWSSVLNGWEDFETVKRKEIESIIDTYGNEPVPAPVSTTK